MQPCIQVWRPAKSAYWRPDTHLQVTIAYVGADGRTRWSDQTHAFALFEDAFDQLESALSHTTDFVRKNWIRVEVAVPNRDAFGKLQGGWIGKDCGVLLATRNLN